MIKLDISYCLNYTQLTSMLRFNPTSVEAGITVSSIVTFASVFYIRVHVGCFVNDLYKLCRKWM